MADNRPVLYDQKGDLWSAVKDGIVVSQDLSPSLRFKPAELRSFAVPELTRAVSPTRCPPSDRTRGRRPPAIAAPTSDKETQTLLTGEDLEALTKKSAARRRRRDLAEKLVSLLVQYQMHHLHNPDSESDKENNAS